jgi:hypothetical protein
LNGAMIKFLQNMKKHTLLAFLMLALPAALHAQFTYTESGGSVTITGYTGSNDVLTIPATINAFPVVNIGVGAFAYFYGITSVTLPDSIISIESNAFFGDDLLDNITFGTISPALEAPRSGTPSA